MVQLRIVALDLVVSSDEFLEAIDIGDVLKSWPVCLDHVSDKRLDVLSSDELEKLQAS